MTEIKQLVRDAWGNAKANGCEPDPDDEQEAISLADGDIEIERWLWLEGDAGDEGFEERFKALKDAVAELRKEIA